MNKLKKPLGRLGRLFHRLSGVDYTIEYIPGAQNFLADFLSRSFTPDSKEMEVKLTEVQSSINLVAEQSKDPEIVSIISGLSNNNIDTKWTSLPNGSRWLLEHRNLYVDDGVLKHSSNRVVVPQHMKEDILKLHHDSPFAGHRGFEPTFISLNRRYYWNYMPSQVKEYCATCTKCQIFNYACLHNKAPLKSIVVCRPWQLVGLDFMGPFKATERGKKYIIIAVDHFTKFIEAAATITFDAKTTALFTLNYVICRYGMVEKILTDQGVNFESSLFKHLCILLGTDKLHTSTYHPEGNGITERINKSIKPNLAKFVNSEHDDWDLHLQMAVSAYNNSYHTSIKMTPYEAMFGRTPVLVSDVIMSNQLPSNTKLKDVSELVKFLRLSADYISSRILENTQEARNRQKLYYDRSTKDRAEFKVGDTVKITNFRVRPGYTKAFEPKFLGPYRIVRVLGDLTFQLESKSLRPEIVHYNRMSHCPVRKDLMPVPQSDPLSVSTGVPTPLKPTQIDQNTPEEIE